MTSRRHPPTFVKALPIAAVLRHAGTGRGQHDVAVSQLDSLLLRLVEGPVQKVGERLDRRILYQTSMVSSSFSSWPP